MGKIIALSLYAKCISNLQGASSTSQASLSFNVLGTPLELCLHFFRDRLVISSDCWFWDLLSKLQGDEPLNASDMLYYV